MNHERLQTVIRTICLVAAVCSSSACFGSVLNRQASAIASDARYEWERVIETGRGCFEDECTPGRWPMAIMPIGAFENKLYKVGRKSVWISTDGISWDRKSKTDWGERYGMVFAFFDNKLWMMGGMRSWDRFYNDVWYSSDGLEWKQAPSNAAWPERRNQSVVIHGGRMWLIGGARSSGSPDRTPSTFYNDVWSSKDGMTWTQVTAGAPWTGRDGQHVAVFDGKLWLIGGTDVQDVWSSADGKIWTQKTAAAEWTGRRGAGVLVFDDRIWLFGGLERNDVWWSKNGRNWQRAFEHAAWSTRGAEYSVMFHDRIWIYGGKTGRRDSWQESGDVWTMKVLRR